MIRNKKNQFILGQLCKKINKISIYVLTIMDATMILGQYVCIEARVLNAEK